jgi:hypothetical protein
MASRTLSIPDNLLPAIALVARHRDKLPLLRSTIEELEPARRTPGPVARQFASKANVSFADARAMINQLMSFHTLQATFGWNASEVFDAILAGLEADAPQEWKTENLEAWKAARKVVEEISAGTHPLYYVQKGLRLKYEHQHILRDANILVDARPLFDEAGRELAQWSIDYIMELEYYDGVRNHQLFATLDSRDIAKIKAQCDRAQTKTATLKAMLEITKRPVVVTGDIDDE